MIVPLLYVIRVVHFENEKVVGGFFGLKKHDDFWPDLKFAVTKCLVMYSVHILYTHFKLWHPEVGPEPTTTDGEMC